MLLIFLLPLLGSGLLFALRPKSDRLRHAISLAFTLATTACVAMAVFGESGRWTVLRVMDGLELAFSLDGLGKVFACLSAFLWPLSTLYAFEYMRHEGEQNTFFGFYLLSFGCTMGIAMAANLFTLYICYELLTLATVPLVMHGKSPQSVAAGRKYLYYCIGGAALGFVTMAGTYFFAGTTEFAFGGVAGLAQAPMTTLCVLFVAGFFGFGAKAAVFPLHSWLPAASVAPTPVTALLHAVAVVKAGAFAVMRMCYYVFSAEQMRGSWAQTVCLAFAIFTIVFGSCMALRQQHLKRRLAYSTASNLNYVLFGALLLTSTGFAAAMLHMVYHALMKIVLFSCVGAIMVQTGRTNVRDLRGLARRMPVIMAAFAFCSIALVGIPPLIGFQSKWALAEAGIASGSVMGTIGVCALLISAVLTAFYLLSPVITAYALPTDDRLEQRSYDPGWRMLTPIAVVCAVILWLAFGNGWLIETLERVSIGLM